MALWTCPDCQRQFGAVGRRHTCTPGLSIAEFFDEAPAFVRPVVEAVTEHLVAVDAEYGGELIIDPLDKKVLLKHGPTFAILHVKTKWVAVSFSLRRKLESGRLSRKVVDYGSKYHHVVNVASADLVDEELRGWLTESYLLGDPDAADAVRDERGGDIPSTPSSGDPMMPDDIDFEIAPPD